MFKNKRDLFNLSLLGIFVWLLIASYNSSKRKPESVGELLKDFSWLSDWPKWLDLPLMPWINKWFKALNENFGFIFEAINKSFDHVVNGGKVGFLFGPEQSGLSNDDVVQADFTISIPLNENFSSLNLSQAVLLICWEWNKVRMSYLKEDNETIKVNKKLKKSTELSNVGDREYFYTQLDDLLSKAGFFYSPEMAPIVKRNIRSLFNRASLTHQDLRTLHGIIRSLSGTSNRT